MVAYPLLLVAVIACSSPAHRAPLSSAVASSATETCALTPPRRTATKLVLRKWLGRIGDRSWIIVARDHRFALAALTDDGSLAITALPARDGDEMLDTAIDGARLWLVVGKPGLGTGEEVLYAVDLAGVAPPIERVETLVAKSIAGATSFAVGPTRALFFTHALRPGFQYWDRATHAPLATEPFTHGFDTPPIRCPRASCFALAVTPGARETRRLTSIRFGDRVEREELAGDHLQDYLLAPVGERSLAVWSSYSRTGLYARTLDADGRPIAPAVQLVPTDASAPQWLPSLASPYLAYRADDWMLAKLVADDHRVERTVALGLPNASWLAAASTTDGVLAVGFSTARSYHGEAVPPTTAHAVFVPGGVHPDPAIDILGPKQRPGYAAFPLVAPGYAAVLVLPQGYDEADAELVMLRTPCR
jgi:hypothetical protein